MHRRKQVDEKSCVTFLLCDSGCYTQTNLTSGINGKKHTQNTDQMTTSRIGNLTRLILSASHDLRLGMDGMLLALCDHGFERSG